MISIDPANVDSQTVANYMFNPINFNGTSASKYVDSCLALSELNLIKNDLDLEPLTPQLKPFHDECVSLGYNSKDLLAVTHTLIAFKKEEPSS